MGDDPKFGAEEEHDDKGLNLGLGCHQEVNLGLISLKIKDR